MRVEPAARVEGHIGVPGDKSVSHRARADRRAQRGRDACRSASGAPATRRRRSSVVRALGAGSRSEDVDTLVVHGVGLHGLRPPGGAARLRERRHARAARQRACSPSRRDASSSIGDASLSRRPMGRVVEPLARMGAAISSQRRGVCRS